MFLLSMLNRVMLRPPVLVPFQSINGHSMAIGTLTAFCQITASDSVGREIPNEGDKARGL